MPLSNLIQKVVAAPPVGDDDTSGLISNKGSINPIFNATSLTTTLTKPSSPAQDSEVYTIEKPIVPVKATIVFTDTEKKAFDDVPTVETTKPPIGIVGNDLVQENLENFPMPITSGLGNALVNLFNPKPTTPTTPGIVSTGTTLSNVGVASTSPNISSGVVQGATVGATIGSAVPVIGTAIGSVVGAIGGGIMSVINANKEDTSTTGYFNFLKSYAGPTKFPTKDEMLAAAKDGNWNSGQVQAIRDTYNQTDGTITQGDWHAKVVSVNPIQVAWFKGANEQGLTKSTIVSAQAAAFTGVGSNNLTNIPTNPVTSYAFGGTSTISQPLSKPSQGTPGGGGGTTSTWSPMMIIVGAIAFMIAVSLIFRMFFKR